MWVRVDAGVAVRVGQLKDENEERVIDVSRASHVTRVWRAQLTASAGSIQFVISKTWKCWRTEKTTGVMPQVLACYSNLREVIKARRQRLELPSTHRAPTKADSHMCTCVASHSLDVELVKWRSSVSETTSQSCSSPPFNLWFVLLLCSHFQFWLKISWR